jgi:hypothetical protein
MRVVQPFQIVTKVEPITVDSDCAEVDALGQRAP